MPVAGVLSRELLLYAAVRSRTPVAGWLAALAEAGCGAGAGRGAGSVQWRCIFGASTWNFSTPWLLPGAWLMVDLLLDHRTSFVPRPKQILYARARAALRPTTPA